MEREQPTPVNLKKMGSLRNSLKSTGIDRHLKKTGGRNDRNVEITTRNMRKLVRNINIVLVICIFQTFRVSNWRLSSILAISW